MCSFSTRSHGRDPGGRAVSRATTSVDLGAGVRVVSGDQTGYGYTEELTHESLRKAAATAAAIAAGPAKASPVAFAVARDIPRRYRSPALGSRAYRRHAAAPAVRRASRFRNGCTHQKGHLEPQGGARRHPCRRLERTHRVRSTTIDVAAHLVHGGAPRPPRRELRRPRRPRRHESLFRRRRLLAWSTKPCDEPSFCLRHRRRHQVKCRWSWQRAPVASCSTRRSDTAWRRTSIERTFPFTQTRWENASHATFVTVVDDGMIGRRSRRHSTSTTIEHCRAHRARRRGKARVVSPRQDQRRTLRSGSHRQRPPRELPFSPLCHACARRFVSTSGGTDPDHPVCPPSSQPTSNGPVTTE